MAGKEITLDSLILRTGREVGPDICLKVDDAIKNLIPSNRVITLQSNITEVLNVIAYFCNADGNRNNNGILDNDSIDLTQSGLHDDATGRYHEENTGKGAHADSLWKDDIGTATTQMIDINELKTLAAGFAKNHIPVGILMRNGNGAAGPLKETNTADDPQREIAAVVAAAPAVAAHIPDGNLKTVFINCIKQMINIMEQTRTIFGPKGWANLYRKMNGGGGGANKNHIKRTHRQHRRRYSSKQY
jgi:hypothetical protein